MEKLKTGLLYLGLHSQLVKKYGVGGIVKRTELSCKLGKHGQIPKQLRHIVIKEMEEKQLLKILNRDDIEILKIDIDIEQDANKLYDMVGIY